MAYLSSGTSNLQLVQNLTGHRFITNERVSAAFKKVDRANYVLDKRDAYIDSPQRIMCNATISAPHMHAYAAEALLPFLYPGAHVLDVGSGSGYTCAIFHHLVSTIPSSDSSIPKTPGKVVGIDHMPALVSWSLENLSSDSLASTLSSGDIEVICGDGREGHAPSAPYDAIHVGAAAPTIPQALIDQLKSPGRMLIPVGTSSQQIILVDKDGEGKVTQKSALDVVYVPLTDYKSQLSAMS